MKCLALHTSINQCSCVVSILHRRYSTESTLKLPKVAPIVPADLTEAHLCEVIMEMDAAEAVKSTTRTPGLILSQPTSILVFLLRESPGIIVDRPRPRPRPQWEAGVRLRRDRKTFGEVHRHPQTRMVTLLMDMDHLHKTPTMVGLHHLTVTTTGITTVITGISSLIRRITVHLKMVGMVLTTGMAGNPGMARVACLCTSLLCSVLCICIYFISVLADALHHVCEVVILCNL